MGIKSVLLTVKTNLAETGKKEIIYLMACMMAEFLIKNKRFGGCSGTRDQRFFNIVTYYLLRGKLNLNLNNKTPTSLLKIWQRLGKNI